MKRPEIPISQFDYELPDDRIPAFPLDKRDESKLLQYKDGEITDHVFHELPLQLGADDLLVVNNTRVIKARLQFRKDTGKLIEVFCLEPADRQDPALALSSPGSSSWNCLVKGSKRWKEQVLKATLETDGTTLDLEARRGVDTSDGVVVHFSWTPNAWSFADVLALAGAVPIPPYLNRDAVPGDEQRYQTVYARFKGSVAAPTAGLHFTDEVLQALAAKGVHHAELTLHVGAGTFRPVKDNNAADHHMHEELIHVNRQVLEMLRATKGRIIPVGTTSMRTLESLYWIAVRKRSGFDPSIVGQWDHLDLPDQGMSREDALDILIAWMDETGMDAISASTGIMIVPGYRFRCCDALITNFHQPKSTLLLLIAAFVGDDWKKVYAHALENGYRFLSFGDSSLLWRRE